VWDGGNDYAGSSPPYGGETLNIDYGPLGAAETPAVPGIPRALPGAGVPNVGRCTMTYSSSAASLPLIMGADGTLQQVGSAGDTTSSFESVCFAAGPLVNVSIRPSTTVATSILAGTIEIPVQAGPSVAGINDSTGFAAGQQVTVGAGTPGAEIGTISGFGSIILSAPLRNAHPADDVIVETEPAPAPAPAPASTPASLTTASSATGGGSGQTLPRTGSSPMPSLAAALLLLSVGGLLVRLSRRRRLLQMADEDHRRFGPQGEVIGG
jgi:LPXTG-motif cell wall-anchored protein